VSSASTSAAAANLVGHGEMAAHLAADGVVIASIASALVNLPIVSRNARNSVLTRRLTLVTVAACTAGILVLAAQNHFWPGSAR